MLNKIKYLGIWLICLLVGISNVKALDVTQDLTLTDDMNERIVVTKGSTVTINLNGHNITLDEANADAISNYGTLTIKGSGVVTSRGAAVINYPGGTVTIDNGEYLSNGWYTIKNMGTMTINNMKFGNNVNNGSSLIVNGYYGNAANDRGQTEADTVMMTINGGTFTNKNNSCNVVKNDDYGRLVIKGGSFIANSDAEDNANPVIQNWHIATIYDGTFTSNHGIVLANGYLDDTADKGELTINGGTFTGSVGIFGTNGSAKQNKGVLTINGGTFNGDATVSTAYKTVINGGIFDDENITPNEEEGYDVYTVIGGENDGMSVVLKEEDLTPEVSGGPVNEDDVDDEILESIEDAIKDKYTLASYYEVEIVKLTKDGDVVGTIEETDEPVEVLLGVPSSLPAVKTGFIRKYYVIRVHNGEVTIIDDVKDNGDGTVTFKSDKFSTYALAYTDVEENIKSPNTFDGISIYLFTILISFVVLAFSSIALKNNN